MENLWTEPPADAWIMTKDPVSAPGGSFEMILGFEKGIPISIDGVSMGGPQLIDHLNKIAGEYGIGRIDMVENRVVGLKSREVYEAPGAILIHMAHSELERITLDRETFNHTRDISKIYANIIYDGKWFGMLRECLDGFLATSQQVVNGEVRIRISAGIARITGRRSSYSLYDEGLATYSHGDTFDRTAAEGFLKLYALPYRTIAQVREKNEEGK
jgi:argininosuccinate synthase